MSANAKGVLAVMDQACQDIMDDRYPSGVALERARAIVAELIEAAEEVIGNTVNARTYPDGPCIDRDERERLIAALARAKGESK